jgi:hypothetical protein
MHPPGQNPYGYLPAPLYDPAPEARRRQRLLRRLKLLLVAGLAAFTLATFLLVRFESALTLAVAGPAAVVRAHLDALNRNDVQGAWNLFSAGYREQIPYENYEELIAQHPDVFRTRSLEFRQQLQSSQRAVLVARLLAADGTNYVARFTLVRAEGRWWIDEMRWTRDRSHRPMITV